MSKSKPAGRGRKAKASTDKGQRAAAETTRGSQGQAMRETVESIVVAVVLAFLFRAFVAEAFVIPTGSMAPTLMGQHKDVKCPQCGFRYEAGASIEIDEQTSHQNELEYHPTLPKSRVVATTCPLCRYRMVLDLNGKANQSTFAGDRILVSKYIYDFSPPKRFDVIVFKFPFNAKQNYIKRLIGLPNEEIVIKRGDIFVKQKGGERFEIARKPEQKLRAMLQMVDDSRYIAKGLVDVGWPNKWQPWAAGDDDGAEAWTTPDHGHSYQTQGMADRDIWLRYRHLVPSLDDWNLIEEGTAPPGLDERKGELITDFYAYNAFTSIQKYLIDDHTYSPDRKPEEYTRPTFGSPMLQEGTLGLHWVGDLAMETDVAVKSDQGELLFRLTKGDMDFLCRIDVATGKASLSISDGVFSFQAADGKTTKEPVGQTRIHGSGTYDVRFSNVDAEIRLTVDGRRVKFDGPTTYAPRDDLRPVWSEADPGDLAPLGIGTRGAALDAKRLLVYRDIYYVARDSDLPPHEYDVSERPAAIRQVLENPELWATTRLFELRGELHEVLGPNQFFPMGDNSPQSSDARMWPEHYFSRRLLIGKALLVYWPHPWYRPIPYFPNFPRMRLIR